MRCHKKKGKKIPLDSKRADRRRVCWAWSPGGFWQCHGAIPRALPPNCARWFAVWPNRQCHRFEIETLGCVPRVCLQVRGSGVW